MGLLCHTHGERKNKQLKPKGYVVLWKYHYQPLEREKWVMIQLSLTLDLRHCNSINFTAVT